MDNIDTFSLKYILNDNERSIKMQIRECVNIQIN